MFEVIPHFFVGIPVGRVTGKVEDMETWLAVDKGHGLLGSVRRSIIHQDDQMTTAVMMQHLSQEMNHLVRSNPLFVQGKQEMPAFADRRKGSNSSALSGDLCFGVFPRGAHVLPKNAVKETFASS